MPSPRPPQRPLPLRLPRGDITDRPVSAHVTDVQLNGRTICRVAPFLGEWRLHNLGAGHFRYYPSESAALAVAHRIARMLSAGETSGRRLTA